MAPLGVHATKNLKVLWCLYYDQVEDCMCKSEGVSMKISLASMMAYIVEYFP